MEADLQAQVAFFLTGKQPVGHLDAITGLALKPALFTGLADLSKLRYDYPLVLSNSADVHSLSGLMDEILEQVGKGDDADRIRKHVLRLEQEIRTRVSSGARGLFSQLWDQAAKPLAKDALTADSLARARAALKVDGELADCDASLPSRLLAHAWNRRQAKKAESFAKDVGRLLLKLSDILKADFVKSDAGRSASSLKESFGAGPMDAFDFETMSRILKKSTARTSLPTLPKSRRKRVEGLIAVLGAQRFFPAGQASEPYTFFFEGCTKTLKAYRERLPRAIELVRAIAIAELEIKGEYSEAKHDLLFASFGENGLDSEEFALFPDYLVCINAGKMPASESEAMTEILSAGLPIKILVQTDDILGDSPAAGGHLGLGLRSRQFASIAMGVNEVFVLQSSASNLYRLRGQLARGLDKRCLRGRIHISLHSTSSRTRCVGSGEVAWTLSSHSLMRSPETGSISAPTLAASSRRPGSFMVALKAARNISARSLGTSGGSTKGRPMTCSTKAISKMARAVGLGANSSAVGTLGYSLSRSMPSCMATKTSPAFSQGR